jgi:alcohol dehydrogenase class IV
MRYNAPVTGARAPALFEALSAHAGDGAPSDAVASLLARLPGPRTLQEIGIGRSDLKPIAEAAMGDWFISRNARPVEDVASLMGVLEAAF